MKKRLSLIIGMIMMMVIPCKSQNHDGPVLVGLTTGYVNQMNAMSMEVDLGYINYEPDYTLEASGIYIKLQPNLTRDIKSVQIVGLHGFIEAFGFRPNIGMDYHFGNTDKINNPLTGYRLSYGIDKTFKNSAFIISVNMSGEYLYVGIGCKRGI